MNLIYSTRSLTSEFVHSLLQQLKIVETVSSDTDILMMTKTNSTLSEIERVSQLNLNPVRYYVDFYEKVIYMENWEEVYDKIDITPLKKYKNLFLFGGILSQNSGLKRDLKRAGSFPVNERGQINFVSIGIYLTHTLALLKANRELGIPLHEIVYDQQELSLNMIHPDFVPTQNYFLYHGYDHSEREYRRLDTLPYYYKQENSFFEEPEKTIDFTFGYTVITKDRTSLDDTLDIVCKKFDTKKLFVHNKLTGVSTFVNREKYLDTISRSKYTLIVRPYDPDAVSIYRIQESLRHDCLPLVMPDVKISLIENSFDVDFSKLIFTDDYMLPSDNQRLELLDYLKSKLLAYRKGFECISHLQK